MEIMSLLHQWRSCIFISRRSCPWSINIDQVCLYHGDHVSATSMEIMSLYIMEIMSLLHQYGSCPPISWRSYISISCRSYLSISRRSYPSISWRPCPCYINVDHVFLYHGLSSYPALEPSHCNAFEDRDPYDGRPIFESVAVTNVREGTRLVTPAMATCEMSYFPYALDIYQLTCCRAMMLATRAPFTNMV